MSTYAPCPQCGQTNAERVGYTWWGGFLGPKLLNHVKCLNCGAKFNGGTGKSNNAMIAVYMVALIIIAILIFSAVRGL